MIGGLTRRGQPLLALVLLLGAWVSARAVMWEPNAALEIDLSAMIDGLDTSDPVQAVGPVSRPAAQPDMTAGLSAMPEMPKSPAFAESEVPYLPAAPRLQPLTDVHSDHGPFPAPPRQAMPPAHQPQFAPVPFRTTVGHHMLWMAALARVPIPADLTALPVEASANPRLTPVSGLAGQAGPKRWSVDSWVLWRRGSVAAATGGLLTPSYGASQAGAVVRYRLAPSSGLRPAAYLRTTAALNGSSERDAALGLQLRPVAQLPIALYGEARMTAVPGRTYVRPAVFAVTELPPFGLPLGLRGEAYGQAGYVGGRNATGFADGQLRVDGRLTGLGKGDLRLGGGLWGGAQKGASRLDAGPTLTIGQPLGAAGSLRLGADWRFRVAGKAAPGSGPAVTLSAGF